MVVALPTMVEEAVERKPFTCNLAVGLDVPMPTLPSLSTRKDVPVDEPMVKAGLPAVLLMETIAHGVEVP